MAVDLRQKLLTWEGRAALAWADRWSVGDAWFFDVVDSTNDIVAQLASEGAKDFTIVVADEQTRGRGRGGSAWSGARASSLFLSVLFRTPVSGSAPGCAPIRIGLAVANAIEGARVKWPNDVVIPGCGKVAGVLCEGVFGSHIVAGVGINVLQSREDLPPELQGRACSVLSATGSTVTRADLLTEIIRGMRVFRQRITDELTPDEIAAFDAIDILRDNEVVCESEGGKIVRGVARGVAEDGALILDASGRVTRVYNGTVRLADYNAYPGTT
jgi:BirA family transcriptional regulator, biotin operon repressor / biotin---[acetyl-CoA-carboxylase] ligase